MGEEGANKSEYRRVQKQYELGMYKLLAIAAIAILAAVALGAFLGNKLGHANALEDVKIKTPEYCTAVVHDDEIIIRCNELDITADELCKVTSPGIKEKLKVLVIA